MTVRAYIRYEDVSPAPRFSYHGGSKGTIGLLKMGLKLCKVSYAGAGKREQQRV